VVVERAGHDPWVVEWARSLDDAADAWRPELEGLIGRLEPIGGSAVLDAGCGSGRVTGWLADWVGPRGLVCALDREPEALAVVADALGSIRDRHIEGWQGDLQHLPFDDDTFDAAWCSRVIGYVQDQTVALAELVRVVRPGGRIVVVTGDAARATFLPIDPALEARLRLAEQRALAAGAWGEPIDIHTGRRLYALARALPVQRVEPVALLWERVAPLTDVEDRYLRSVMAWLVDPISRRWLRRDWEECRRLFHPDSSACVLDAPDLHVVQTATAVVITV
jgi:SAM-dependent methyltransferase